MRYNITFVHYRVYKYSIQKSSAVNNPCAKSQVRLTTRFGSQQGLARWRVCPLLLVLVLPYISLYSKYFTIRLHLRSIKLVIVISGLFFDHDLKEI